MFPPTILKSAHQLIGGPRLVPGGQTGRRRDRFAAYLTVEFIVLTLLVTAAIAFTLGSIFHALCLHKNNATVHHFLEKQRHLVKPTSVLHQKASSTTKMFQHNAAVMSHTVYLNQFAELQSHEEDSDAGDSSDDSRDVEEVEESSSDDEDEDDSSDNDDSFDDDYKPSYLPAGQHLWVDIKVRILCCIAIYFLYCSPFIHLGFTL